MSAAPNLADYVTVPVQHLRCGDAYLDDRGCERLVVGRFDDCVDGSVKLFFADLGHAFYPDPSKPVQRRRWAR